MRIAFLALLCGLAFSSSASAADRAKPNIVFILADDLGWTDLGCQGSKYYETPHIDALAAKGLRFTNGYTCGPNCQPTRATLMSGQYGPRTGIYTVGSIDRFNWQSRPLRPVDNVVKLPLKVTTIAQAMKSAGYATGMFGKWHLGEDPQHHPSARGFDEAIASAGKHFDFATNPKTAYPKGTYLADFLTDKAVDFIDRHQKQPFFLYLPHFGVHSPFQAKDDIKKKFASKEGVGGHKDPTYAAMIASVDESVGRVMAKLNELKLAEDTLVIFSSDNGGVGGYVRDGLKKTGDVTDNAPLRSGKGSLYEGGTRVPFIFHWPGKIPVGISETPIIGLDLYPTFLALGSGTPPKDQPLDGVDLTGHLKSGGTEPLAREALYWHFPGYLGAGMGMWRTTPAGAIRKGDYKLLEFFEDNRVELYNLKDDPSQLKDISKAQPERAKELQTQLAAWRIQVNAPMPTKNTPTKKKK